MSSRYPTQPDAIRANDEDCYSVPGSRHQMILSILDGGPNENGQVSLIPQANVIQAAHYGDLGRREATLLEWGAILHVQGFGCLKVVQDRNNPDWPRLVPLDGDRYYSRFKGFGAWSIHDRDQDGKVLPFDTVREALNVLGFQVIDSRAKANAVAAYLSATA